MESDYSPGITTISASLGSTGRAFFLVFVLAFCTNAAFALEYEVDVLLLLRHLALCSMAVSRRDTILYVPFDRLVSAFESMAALRESHPRE